MKARDLGAYVRVTVSAREVEEFARRWSCFGPRRALGFTLEKRSGDLVDVSGDRDMDERGVLALSHDANNYAAERLRLPSLRR